MAGKVFIALTVYMFLEIMMIDLTVASFYILKEFQKIQFMTMPQKH